MRQKKTSTVASPPINGGEVSNALNSPAGQDEEPALVLALIDPKPLTRQSIIEVLAKALPDYMTVAASGCEELLDMRESPPGGPHLVVIHTRSPKLTDAGVQNTL